MGFRVEGLGFGVWGLGFGAWSRLGFRVWGIGVLRVHGGYRFRIKCPSSGVQVSRGFGVSGFRGLGV